MSRQNQLGSHKTTLSTDDGLTRVVYHQTAVVKFNHEKVILDNGGWYTNTTKTRMNQASNQFGLGYSVYQKKGDWFVTFKGETIPFTNGMTLTR